MRRLLAFLRFLVIFSRELIQSNLSVARATLFAPATAVEPAFLRYRIQGLTSVEITLLTHCITLTPGTVTVEIAEERDWILIHVLDGTSPEEAEHSIRERLEKPILAFLR